MVVEVALICKEQCHKIQLADGRKDLKTKMSRIIRESVKRIWFIMLALNKIPKAGLEENLRPNFIEKCQV